MKFKFLSLMFMIPFTAYGNDLSKQEIPFHNDGGGSAAKIVKLEESVCPDRSKIEHICVAVSDHEKEGDVYVYQTYLAEAACVTDNDTKEVKEKKIRDAWLALEDYLVCSSVQFDVRKGNILKYAVAKKLHSFINHAVEWKVNLNRIDRSDKRTVLDYVKDHLEKNRGNDLAIIYDQYYAFLRSKGAKHASEL